MSGEDLRIHARLHLSAKVTVGTPDGSVDAVLQDLSKGGARFLAPSAVGAVGDTVEIFLPSMGQGEITATCEIIRSVEGPKGHTVAVRFDAMGPETRAALLPLIDELLATTGGGSRAHPRISRRVDLRFGDLQDYQAILEDISTGGLQMSVEQPLVLHEEIDVVMPDLGGTPLLTLRAQIVHQRADRTPAGLRYRVGLEFVNMRPETRRCLDELIRSVLEADDGGEQ